MSLQDFYNNNKKGIAGALGLYGTFGGQGILSPLATSLSNYISRSTPQVPGGVTQAPNQSQGTGLGSNPGGYTPPPMGGSGMTPPPGYGGSTPPPIPTQTSGLRQFDPNQNYYETARNAGDMSTADLIRLRGHLIDQRGNIAVGAANGTKTDPKKLGFDPFDVAKRAGINLSPDNQDEINKSVANIYSPMVSDVTGLIEAGLAKDKAASGSNAWNQGIFQGMSNQQADDITRRIDTNYTNLDIVKDFRKLTQQAATILAVDPNNMNSSQAQGLISDYAKSLDPTSVVRTEEYLTSKKYSQSFINKIKGEISQAATGTGVLSPDAVKVLQDATRARYDAVKPQIEYAKNNVLNQLNAMYPGKDFSPLVSDFSIQTNQPQSGVEYFGGQPFKMNPSTGLYEPVTQGFNQVGGGTKTAMGGNRPQRNNNPLNIKASDFTSKFPGVKGYDPKPSSDGGYFLTFASPQDGFNAAVKLFKEGKSYRGKTVDQALRIWSNNGYGGNIAPQYANMPVQSLPDNVLQQIIQKMASAEGYYA
jgi:hypothetical protein